jgi:hypothetical protein
MSNSNPRTLGRALRQPLRRWFLRGPVLHWWVGRRARQWEQDYCAQLVQAGKSSSRPASGPVFTTSAPLRRILFIADCMWEQNDLVPELCRIAEVIVLDLHPTLRAKAAAQTESEAVAAAVQAFADAQKQLAPDVILFYARPNLLSEAVFQTLRGRWHCPVFGMNLDDKLEFFPYQRFRSASGNNYVRWGKQFDLNLTNCVAATEWYGQHGLACLYSPQGVHLTADLTLPTSLDYQYELSFLGSRKPERALIIDQLAAAGIPVQLFGSGWPNSQWVESPNAVFRSTQINLGIGFASPSLTLTTTKGRDFECPGVGACYLTTYNWELVNLYELGKEMLCYRSVEELIEMYSWYRKRPEECLKIAQAAWRRSVNEHTWEKRFRKVFETTGFRLEPPFPR